jgi:hypothetical protein
VKRISTSTSTSLLEFPSTANNTVYQYQRQLTRATSFYIWCDSCFSDAGQNHNVIHISEKRELRFPLGLTFFKT